ncbi:MAG: 2-amino-4-hydroxy-6-hydroxymethyldihydropteridine diphosphokinase [Thermoguttaceae bacterium]|jgi:2-amino-4-hydroxy-6-hydroxymethyldihydropteridine diphosphokinase
MMPICLVGLGSNLGDRRRMLDDAVERLRRSSEVRVVAVSPWLETRPVGGPPGQADYLNGAAVLETSLDPEPLLRLLQQIEDQLGRQRHERWAARTIDLDLLLCDQLVQATASLVLPHPRMAWRRFVLGPAALVAPDMLHPQIGWTVRQLLDHLDTSPWYVAICGVVGSDKTSVARQVAQQTGARLLAAPATPEHRLEWLEDVAGLLDANRAEWHRNDSATVSDFWLGSSAAAARLCLPRIEWAAYRTRWEHIRSGSARQRLIVLLETPGEEVLRRLGTRPGGQRWTARELERMAVAIADAAVQSGQGPLLRLSGADIEAAADEVTAALEAMR